MKTEPESHLKLYSRILALTGLIMGIGLGIAPSIITDNRVYAKTTGIDDDLEVISNENTTEAQQPNSENLIETRNETQIQELGGGNVITTQARSSSGNSLGSGSVSSITPIDLGLKIAPGGEVGILKEAAPYEADNKLVDRLLPVLYKKISANQLLEKIFPYLDTKIMIRDQTAEERNVGVFGVDNVVESPVWCNENEVIINGGYHLGGPAPYHGNTIPVENRIDITHRTVSAFFDGDGTIQAWAQCMKVELGMKGSSTGNVISGTSSDLGIKTKSGSDTIKETVP